MNLEIAQNLPGTDQRPDCDSKRFSAGPAVKKKEFQNRSQKRIFNFLPNVNPMYPAVVALAVVRRGINKRPYFCLSCAAVISAVLFNMTSLLLEVPFHPGPSSSPSTTTTSSQQYHHHKEQDRHSQHHHNEHHGETSMKIGEGENNEEEEGTSTHRSSTWVDPTVTSTWSLGAFGAPSYQDQVYDWDRSTEENYRASDNDENEEGFYGPFRSIRQRLLDHRYHSPYSKTRQAVQDAVLLSLLSTTTVYDRDTGRVCSIPTNNWIVFTAGCYGAGKTHTIRKLHESGEFPLDGFVQVDPDEIRRRLPEFHVYIQRNPERAGELTRKEAGMMAELLTNHALEQGQNVLVDGSLRDAEWYEEHFADLRKAYPKLRIGIFHVTAPPEAVFERVQQRAKATGRVVPVDALLRSMDEVPKAVKRLSRSVDLFLEVYNPPQVDSESMPEPKGVDPGTIAATFRQHCPA